MKKRTVALLLALVLCAGCAVGGTVAWLMDTTDTITNTFTYSDITITLTESGVQNNANSYKMVPGGTIAKDPKITVETGSEDCWLFVKLEKSTNYGTYLENYIIADDWTELGGSYEGVYYIKKPNIGTAYPVIKGNTLTVSSGVTKEQMAVIKDGGQPTLSITAYAIQYANLDYDTAANDTEEAVIAWNIVKTNPASFPNP